MVLKLKLSEKCFFVRKFLNFTQKQYGQRIGCSQGMVSLIERGYQVDSSLRDYIERDYDLYRLSIKRIFCVV